MLVKNYSLRVINIINEASGTWAIDALKNTSVSEK